MVGDDLGTAAAGQPTLLGSLLDERTRRIVADLNRGFLCLCLDERHGGDPRFQLPGPVRERFARLPVPALSLAAGCPFTLFELRLLRLVEAVDLPGAEPSRSRVADPVPHYPSVPIDPRSMLFVHQALFFAWHLASTAPLTGRLSLGCPASAEVPLSSLSPARLSDCSALDDLLRPRWTHQGRFWTGLLDAVELQSAGRLQRAHCHGLQLLAAELNGRPEPGSAARPGR